jgi:hypothetical protein
MHHAENAVHRRLGLHPILDSRRHRCHFLRHLLLPHLPLLLSHKLLHAAVPLPAFCKSP